MSKSPGVSPEVLRQVKLLELQTRGLVNSLLKRETVPKRCEPDRSAASITVSSRSSM